jgi:hypothetical protein
MRGENTLQPKHFQPGEGKSFKVGRMTMTFKTTAALDWNAYTVCEAIKPPNLVLAITGTQPQSQAMAATSAVERTLYDSRQLPLWQCAV